MNILEVNDLNVYYGAIHAIKNISFEIKKGEIVTLIGANGAGKTSTLHAVSGLLPLKSGEVSLNGVNITGWKHIN
jgi:branched-chain amino acid transport system ATP-binding protein